MHKLILSIVLTVASLGAVVVTPDKSQADPPAVLYGTYSYGSPYYSYSYVAPAPGYYRTTPDSGSYYYQSPYYGSYRLNAGNEPSTSPAPAVVPVPVTPAPAPVNPAPSYYDPNYRYGSYIITPQVRYWGTSPTGFYSSYYVPYF